MTQEHLRARTIRRLATKYAPSDDTGTPSSQNYNGGTLRAQTMESHFPMSMKSAAHIRDILATRITMGERSGHRPGTDLGIAFPNEYAVRTAHWRHPCDQNYNGGMVRFTTRNARSAEGCSRTNDKMYVSPHVRAIDTHDLRRGLLTDKRDSRLTTRARDRWPRFHERVAFRKTCSHRPAA